MSKAFQVLVLNFLVCFGMYGQSGLVLGNEEGFFRKNPSASFFLKDSLSAPFFSTSLKNAIYPQNFLPDFVRENPRGYSYLCRLELEVEEKLPLGIWFKIGDNYGLPGGNAHVRFRLFNF
jgi:hypothetical protein